MCKHIREYDVPTFAIARTYICACTYLSAALGEVFADYTCSLYKLQP